ncbi:MAG: DUF3131 domain-containing protein [Oscillospiraceae bacterium]|jgi:cyclic beta-1,2-glucan synthetase|nr:DUF3131 domain-containing protein [Oscillospiraceae bacterium]
MEAWIAFAGLLLLLIFSATQRRRTPPVQDVALEDEALCAHLQAIASAQKPRERGRLHGATRSARRLRRALTALGAMQSALPEARQGLLPGAQWLADNARTLEDSALTLVRQVRRVKSLPLCGGQPRVQLISRELISHTDGKLHAENIKGAVACWQGVQLLTLRELWALPLALSATLMELLSHLARTCAAAQRDRIAAEEWARTMAQADLSGLQKRFAHAPHSTAFFAHLLKCLRDQENAAALGWLDRQLDALDLRAERVVEREHARQALERQWIGNSVTSLRALGQVRWAEVLEDLSSVEGWLRDDAAGVYPRMSEESRALYRSRVEAIAHRAALSEIVVARNACELAEIAANTQEDALLLRSHVGYYLLDAGEVALWQRLGGMPVGMRATRWGRVHAAPLYVTARLTGTVGLCLAGLSLGLSPWLLLFAAPVAGAGWAALLHAILRRLRAPQVLPRIAYDSLPDTCRTLVVVPTLLSRPDQARHMMRHLAVLQRANPDPNLQFMLLADFPDGPAAEQPDDAEILRAASSAVRGLNSELPGAFLYFHRARVWCDAQKKFMGPERKRGALAALNELLLADGTADEGASIAWAAASCDPACLRGRYRQVITLDSDTLLPPGSALALVGMLTHPLNAPMTLGGVPRGKALIQPRMETAAHGARTRLARIFGGAGGVDPYLSVSSDIYQDLYGRGSFAGKGIYNVAVFARRTGGMIRPNTVLSHDLLEGELCGAALASDLALYDSQPATLRSWMMRLHRWTRGDWQLLPWLLPRVRARRGLCPNPLDALARYKIWDNLRRSLTPVAQCALLLGGALAGSWPTAAFALLPWLGALLPPGRCALRAAALDIALLPYQACIQTDAILRTLWRVCFSRRHLLEWVTASDAERTNGTPYTQLMRPAYALAAALVLCALLGMRLLPLAVVLAAVWSLSPALAQWLDAPAQPGVTLSPRQRHRLLRIARDTWRFFERTVTASDHFLPPDNLQLQPDRGLAHRTSPTNIGLYLLSCASAYTLGFIEADQMARRVADTLDTLDRLPTWRGHLYNWYDTRTLAPLHPHYVSAVDSGNLAGCLLACAQIIRRAYPALDPTHRCLPARLEALWQTMELSALYDPQCELFFIGIHPETGRTGDAHYDLLASEARLLSFLAVMRGDAPPRHWQRLGRLLLRTHGGVALASWSGTLFEYLMPALLMRLTPGTLLAETCKQAALEQRRAAEAMPWGTSESGYYAFDPQLCYQYRAFGLPRLALRNDAFAPVAAPYASALALPVLPQEACANLLRMRAMGWCGELGFYEAADYTANASAAGAPYQLVRSHMAHHQGMVLCALCNLLADNALVEAFHARPEVEAFALLLEERIPSQRRLRWRTHAVRRADTTPKRPLRAVRHVQPETMPLETQLLYGDGTTLLCDARGGGYIAHNGLMLTRWRPDPLVDGYGLQCYLHDAESGDTWRAAQPGLPGETRFETGLAVFQREQGGILSVMQCAVCPLDGAALHLLTLTNHSDARRRLRVSSFFEAALSPQAADVAHPAFRNLFIETSRLGPSAIQARRRPRAPEERFPLLLHVAAGDMPDPWQAHTDRARFLGREASDRRAPQALRDADGDMVGAVVDPCMALLTEISLAPGATTRLAFATLTAESAEDAAALASRYADIGAALRGLELAQTQAQVAADYLSLDPSAQHQAQRLASYALYHGQSPHPRRLPAGTRALREELWACGLSGDLPILTLDVRESSHLPLARAVLKIHEAWRQWGLWVDLALLGDHGGDYYPPVRSALQELVSCGHARDLVGKPGGVYFLDAQVLTAPRCAALLAASALVLRGEDGPLGAQMKALRASLDALPTAWPALPHAWPNPGLPSLPRALWNGWGGFTADGDYAMDLSPGHPTPAPWCNILANPDFGALVTERGAGFTYVHNSHSQRLTPWCNDPVAPRPGEALYLRDERTGQFVSLFAQALRVTHGPGFSTYEGQALGLGFAMTVFVDAQEPLKHTLLLLENPDSAPRHLSLTAYATWCMGSEEGGRHLWAEALPGLCLAHSADMDGVALLALPGMAQVQNACDRAAFLGLGGPDCPRGMALTALDELGADDPCAVLRAPMTLAPKGSAQAHALLGWAPGPAEARRAAQTAAGQALPRLQAVRALWAHRLGGLTVRTPDAALNHLLNRWLPYQLTVSRLWARAGFYQAGGAIGFRDQLQDALALIHTDPAAVRSHLLLCAAHQFEAGDVQHWWHPPARGVRTRMTDDLLFLPYVTAAYVHATGDRTVLQEAVPYLRDVDIPAGQEDWYGQAQVSPTAETLLQHCRRAIARVRLGARGLPLMGGGDWNDALNRVGAQGRGESVWLAWFFAATLHEFAPLCGTETRDELLALESRLLRSAETHAWDGDWYRRAWFDDGTPLGSAGDTACELDCIAQSWAVLAGADRVRGEQAMDAVWQRLVDVPHGLVRLLTPPFDEDARDPGYIQGYLPGIRENGGQYTHAAAWAVLAFAKLGQTQRAWMVYRMLMPCAHSDSEEAARRYRLEPYVCAADVYANPRQMGRGGWSWYTGSAAWLWMAGMQGLLGFEKLGARLRLHPLLPQDWDEIVCAYRYGASLYRLIARRGAVCVTLDGQRQADGWITLTDDGAAHEATFPVRGE